MHDMEDTAKWVEIEMAGQAIHQIIRNYQKGSAD